MYQPLDVYDPFLHPAAGQLAPVGTFSVHPGTKLPGAWAERSAMLEMAPVGRNGACCRSPERTIHLTKLAIVLRFLSKPGHEPTTPDKTSPPETSGPPETTPETSPPETNGPSPEAKTALASLQDVGSVMDLPFPAWPGDFNEDWKGSHRALFP